MKYQGVNNDEAQLSSLTLGGAAITGLFRLSASLTPAQVAAASAAEQTFTVAGVKVGDNVSVTPPGITAGVAPVTARVTAADTIGVTFVNPTAGALTPAAGVYRFIVSR